jgi:hypothetical protein
MTTPSHIPGHRRFTVCDGAVVETFTISPVAEFPGVAEEGDTEQLASAGAPLQVNDTDWLNPPEAAKLSEYCAVCPGETVTEAEPAELTFTLKSPPCPVSNPKAPTPFVVPTYTFPLAMVGVMNLLPVPNWSRVPAWLLL